MAHLVFIHMTVLQLIHLPIHLNKTHDTTKNKENTVDVIVLNVLFKDNWRPSSLNELTLIIFDIVAKFI